MLKKRTIKENLCKKGFVVDTDSRSNDHIYLRYVTPDNKKTTIVTKISHSKQGQEISKNLESKMAKQIHLCRADFVEFAKCSISEEQYYDIVKDEI